MAGAFMYQIFTSSSLFSVGIYHIVSTTRNFLKSPQTYSSKPYHPFPFSSSSSSPSSSSSSSATATHHNQNRFLKHTQLYLTLICLLIALTHQILVSADNDPLLKGRTPVHRLISFQSVAVTVLFLLLTTALLLSESSSIFPLPSDLFFALAAAAFFLQYSVSSSAAAVQTSDLQAKCDSVFAQLSILASGLCLILSLRPNLFIFDIGFGGSLCLLGLWELQTGLSLYVDAFIPEGCHKLLDVVSGVEGSTKCDLDESRLRAVAILDLVFLFHVMFVLLLVMLTYLVVAKCVGIRRFGSYESLPNIANAADSSVIQMKSLTGTQA